MRPPPLSLSYLPSWAKLNDIVFEDISVETNKTYGGYGIVTTTTIIDSSGDEDNPLALLKVPKDLILNSENIVEHSKADKHLRELLEVVGGNVIMLLFYHVDSVANVTTVLTWGCNAVLIDANYKSFIRPKQQYQCFRTMDGVCQN